MTTLKVTGISNRYTKWSHLIGGIFMALLGVLMLFKPAWIMFNFSDNSSVKALSYGDFYKETNIEDIKFDDKVNIYIFRGEGCPHCRDLTNLITEYINEHPFDYNVYEFEVWNNKDNSKLMMSIAELVGNKDDATGVPYLLVGRHSMIGYADYNADKVKEMLKVERETKASERIDYMRNYLSNKDSEEKTTTSTTTIAVPNTTKKKK
jgi:glutaredoxin